MHKQTSRLLYAVAPLNAKLYNPVDLCTLVNCIHQVEADSSHRPLDILQWDGEFLQNATTLYRYTPISTPIW